MYTEENVKNLSTLRIHKLTQAQYDRESSNDALEENSIYLTPYETINGDNFATVEQLNGKANLEHRHIIDEIDTLQEKLDENLQSAEKYTDEQIKNKIGENNVTSLINTHNGDEEAHNDIRVIIDEIGQKLTKFLNVDESTVDELSDVLALIEENKGSLDSLTNTKINISDIIDNLTTSSSNKVLSAKQGYELKKLIDVLRGDVDSKVPNTRKVNGKVLTSDITIAADDIKTGTFSYERFPTVPVTKGGTGADTPEQALINLGINATAAEINILDEAIISTKELNYLKSVTNPIQSQLDGKASLDHSHSASDINSGELSTSVLPVIPVEKGGTGASDSEGALIGLGLAATADEINTLSGVNITTDELNFLSGAKSNIQSQVDNKQDEITGGASSITSSNLTKNRVLVSNNSGKVGVSTIPTSTLNYLSNVTSDIQSQLDGKASSDHSHNASDINSGELGSARLPVVPIEKGGTGANNAEDALVSLGINATADDINILNGAEINTSELNYLKGLKKSVIDHLNDKQDSITGGASSIVNNNIAANMVLVSDNYGKVSASNITSTELGCLDNISSNIQTQLDNKQPTITGGASSVTSNNLTANRVLISNNSGKVAVSDITSTKLGYLDSVTSDIQTQLNSKQSTITGGATSIASSNLTASRALVSDNSGKVAISDVTSTELGYLDGVTSSIQDQLNGKVSKAYGSIYISDGALVGHSAQTTSDEITFIAGNNISINGKDNGDSFSITIAATDTTYENATKDSPGLMSNVDKTKLDGIPSNANYYVHETGSGYNHIPSGGSNGQFLKYSSSGVATWSAIPTASSSTLGGVKVGTGLSISDSKLSVSNPLPTVTASNNGQFLRVVNGAWAAVTIKTAESEAL